MLKGNSGKNVTTHNEKFGIQVYVVQEVEAAANAVNYDFSSIDKPKTFEGKYSLRYAEFVVPLVKAMKEPQQQIDALKKENDNQKKNYEDQKKINEELLITLSKLENQLPNKN